MTRYAFRISALTISVIRANCQASGSGGTAQTAVAKPPETVAVDTALAKSGHPVSEALTRLAMIDQHLAPETSSFRAGMKRPLPLSISTR